VTIPDLRLTREVAAALLGFESGSVNDVEFLRPANHSWRVTSGDSTFYVKAHTKTWYQHQPASSIPVRHEVTGHRLLRAASLPSAEVVSYSTRRDNPLGWPYLITRQLAGISLIELLHIVDRSHAEQALRAVGRQLAGMHALTYDHPGYFVDGPPAAPRPDQWLHWLCRLERFLLYFCDNIAAHAGEVDLPTNDAAAGLLHRTLPQLRQAYLPLRFVHGDCHASAFFLADREGAWQVSGVIDLENCAAGAPAFDLIKLFIELAGHFRSTIDWWRPLFQGYGSEPDFDLIRLLLIGHAHINFTCLGDQAWPGTRADILRRILSAQSWGELFDLR
jgi:Ser/Thr protein kinase RdoA (MazF antagonist)